jgi:predicted phosphodiesterase
MDRIMNISLLKKLFLIIFSIIFINTSAYPASNIISQWVELGPNNIIIARAVISATQCPTIILDKQNQVMQLLHTATTDFPNNICQTIIPSTVKSASINGTALPLPISNPTKIVIVGDSGCRIKKSGHAQACNNPLRWPFALVANHAAAWKPDLVIHVGDYLYREYACKNNHRSCAGSPFGDNWKTWQADFFYPATPLLQTAPWIFARGNHEICHRNGQGWYQLLSPLTSSSCTDFEPIYSINLGNVRLFIIDTAEASDIFSPSDQVSFYEDNLKTVKNSTAIHNWIITHKPFWFVRDHTGIDQALLQSHFTNAQQSAWNEIQPANVDLLLSGHVHVFQTVNFDNGRPPQVIVGASGATLNNNLAHITQLQGYNSGEVAISSGINIDTFGYMTLEKQNKQWIAQMRTPDGKILANCVLQQKQFICQKTAKSKKVSLKKATQ